MSDPIHFDAGAIRALEPGRVADAMAAGLAMVARGEAIAPIRGHVDLGGGAGTYLISGVLAEIDLMTVKVINVRPANAGLGLERLQGSLVVFEASTGRPVATLDARAATEARTAACSAVSVRLLARPDTRVLTVFGTGPQARAHLRALMAERNFEEVRIVGHRAEAAEQLAATIAHGRSVNADEALRRADVVVTATNSIEPLFTAAAVEPGTHLAVVGSGNAQATEIDFALLARALVRVDHRPTCLEEAGEVVGALRAGLITAEDIRELGEVVIGRAAGRRSPEEITLYKSVGNGTQDAALAGLLLGLGMGQ